MDSYDGIERIRTGFGIYPCAIEVSRPIGPRKLFEQYSNMYELLKRYFTNQVLVLFFVFLVIKSFMQL